MQDMSQDRSVADRQHRQHSLSDWLALHELDPATCHHVLDVIARDFAAVSAGHDGAKPAYQPPDLDNTWLRAVAAMRDLLPGQCDLVDDTFANSDRIVVDRPGSSRKAVTLDNGPCAYPTILYTYRGTPAEHLVMAHEFGHAVQLRASQGRFLPPILREVCAFLGEDALLSRARHHHAAQHAGLAHAWRRDSHRYFGVQSERLRAALATPAAPYIYSWNYPVARYLAVSIARRCSPEQVWAIFAGRASTGELLRGLA